jgi:hypothetical protein
MKAVLPRSWSIGKRLIFLYTIMICVVLVVSGLLLDWILRSDLSKEDERFLATQIQSIRILLREYPDDTNIWKAEVERDTQASASTFAKYYVRITDRNGKTLIETPGMPRNPGEPTVRKSTGTAFVDIDYTLFTTQEERPFLFALAPAAEYDTAGGRAIIQ